MQEQEINNIRKVVTDYGKVKADVIKQRKEQRELFEKGQISYDKMEDRINHLYKGLEDTQERKTFVELANKIQHDPEGEKYLRATCMDVFLGIKVDPSKL